MVKMQTVLLFFFSVFVSLFLVGCVSEIDSKQADATALKQHTNDQIQNIKKEIDYWYTKMKNAPEIGEDHYNLMKERLEALQSKMSVQEYQTYLNRLDAIPLLTKGSSPVGGQKGVYIPGKVDKYGVEEQRRMADLEGCEGKGAVTFTYPPMRVEDIGLIQPTGLMIGGHVTPIDHGYYSAKTWVGAERHLEDFVDVLAPADGVILVGSMPKEFATSEIGDYRMTLYHSCTFFTIYIHVNQLSEKLQQVVDTGKKVKVVAGEVIGRAPGFDFSVHNLDVVLPGFVDPVSYSVEDWKIHTVDMFEPFAEPLRSQLLAFNPRQVEPRGGKIDYDIEGKLIGNWFVEGSGGYRGRPEYNRMTGYWKTHAAFVPDAYDPSYFIVSLGDFEGEARQFGTKINSPNPASVGVGTGIVKYELVKWGYKTDTGVDWDRGHFARVTDAYAQSEVFGTVLVQMVGERKLKLEVFAGKKASEVTGFSGREKVYVR